MSLGLADQWSTLGNPHVCVVGDVILDRYHWGVADRISPEAPVLLLQSQGEEDRLGGAASVACLLQGLGCAVSLVGVVGNDNDGERVRKLLTDLQIDTTHLFTDPSRPTTLKTRILGGSDHRQPHQLMRLDRESRCSLNSELADRVSDAVLANFDTAECMLVSDYGKGVCNGELLGNIFEECKRRHHPVLADPAKNVSFERYRYAPLLTPNRTEASRAAGFPIEDLKDAERAIHKLCDEWDISTIALKLDRDGMLLGSKADDPIHIKTTPQAVCDVTGAGDMVLAVFGLCLSSEWDLGDAAQLAIIAASLEVQEIGVAQISRERIASSLQNKLPWNTSNKRLSVENAKRVANQYRSEGKRIVLTNGCFDLLHRGHLDCLEQAAAQGNVLFVAVNDDRSVARLKGTGRPIVNESDRITLVAALQCVNHVILMDSDTPAAILDAVRPDVLVKGAPYDEDQVVGRERVIAYGGKVVVVPQSIYTSTTALVADIRHR